MVFSPFTFGGEKIISCELCDDNEAIRNGSLSLVPCTDAGFSSCFVANDVSEFVLIGLIYGKWKQKLINLLS